jgi:hypothetical protein
MVQLVVYTVVHTKRLYRYSDAAINFTNNASQLSINPIPVKAIVNAAAYLSNATAKAIMQLNLAK